ncbi:winged helix-turn-helix domain-containing protein [Ideonella sp. YS5]|uniref:winged helix-turn-helix domain-containing protein n=1 Tax=Ideonella sp. YS5 TaxID=3453714 RepID=UPI003EEDECB5
MSEVVFRFGRCEVNGARRQVVVDGMERPLEPRPFDALLYLLHKRHRVVSKDELLDAVWGQRHVSPGVISRAVSLIRKALGDESRDAPLVRTVHGVGLRFVGDVTVFGEEEPPDAEPGLAAPMEAMHAPWARVRRKSLRLAVLPFDNRTGDAALDWIEFGLSSLTARALERNSRFAVVPLPELQRALAAVHAAADTAERAEGVLRLLGVDGVLQAEVRRDPAGFRLNSAYASSAPELDRRSLRGSDLVTLSDQLAAALSLTLSPVGDTRQIHFEPMDPLSGQAFARALQAVGEQQWKRASHLLRVALDLEPDSTLVRKELFSSLAMIGDESALPLGEDLMSEAEALGHPEQLAFVHHMLGRCHAVNRSYEPARRHLDEALLLSQSEGPWEWSGMAMQYRFQLAMHHGEVERTRDLMEVMKQTWAHSANHCLRVNWLSNLAAVSWRQGHMTQSLHASWQARELSAEFNLAGDHAAATSGLAVRCGELGMFESAVEYGEAALKAGLAMAQPMLIAPAACSLCWMYRETRSPRGAEVVGSLDSPEYKVAAGLPGLWMARAHHAAVERRFEDAAAYWREAVARARRQEASHAEYVALPWLLVALVQADCLDEAHRLLAELYPRPDIAGYPRMMAALRHGEALALHAAGERDAALALLEQVAREAPQSHWRASACMDAAWLNLDAGRPELAGRLVLDLGPWLQEHPVGRMLAVRCRQAEAGLLPEVPLAQAAASPRWLPSRS